MKQNNKSTGNKGESLACDLLRQKGYTIVERNYKSKWGEVDIICKTSKPKFSPHPNVMRVQANSQIEEKIVFVEVKTKTGDKYGEPWEMINSHKLHQVQNMGHLWCEEYGWKGRCRVDVVGVWLGVDGEMERVEHWENVQM